MKNDKVIVTIITGKDFITSWENYAKPTWEKYAEKQGYDVEVGDFPYAVNGLALARDEMSGAVKIISDARYGEILGVHIVGAHATELVGEAVLAMQLEATAHELAKSIRLHPTFSESVVDAARDAEKWALYLPRT